MLNTTDDRSGIAPLDGAEVDGITRRVRGSGWFTRRTSLFDACEIEGANCTDLLPWSACIERALRVDCLATRIDGDGVEFTARCDVLDAWTACARLAPDTGVITPGDSGLDITLPPQDLPARGRLASMVAIAGVAVASLAVWKAVR